MLIFFTLILAQSEIVIHSEMLSTTSPYTVDLNSVRKTFRQILKVADHFETNLFQFHWQKVQNFQLHFTSLFCDFAAS